MPVKLVLYFGTALASHYVASLVQMSLHYVLGHHAVGGVFHRTHTGEHHAIYSADALLAERYSDRERDVSLYYVLPAAGVALAAFTLLPLDIFLVHVATLALSFAAHVYLHVQYHLTRPWLARFRWFEAKRRLHLLHHLDESKNFAVIEFVWDRVLGTYQPARP